MDFENLIKEAQNVLNTNETDKGLATAFFTDKGNIYVRHHKSFDESYAVCTTLNHMVASEDTKVLKTVTVFSGGCLEVPSAWLREFLYELNNDNENTEVLMPDGKQVRLLRDYRRQEILT